MSCNLSTFPTRSRWKNQNIFGLWGPVSGRIGPGEQPIKRLGIGADGKGVRDKRAGLSDRPHWGPGGHPSLGLITWHYPQEKHRPAANLATLISKTDKDSPKLSKIFLVLYTIHPKIPRVIFIALITDFLDRCTCALCSRGFIFNQLRELD